MKATPWATAAAATMLACAAHAQNSVTIYGLMDAGVQLEDASNGKTLKVVSGGNSGSRLGFRGAEDLGGGLSFIFTAEHGINIDTGGLAQGGRFFGRQVFAGFKGNWGTLVAGRVATLRLGHRQLRHVQPGGPDVHGVRHCGRRLDHVERCLAAHRQHRAVPVA